MGVACTEAFAFQRKVIFGATCCAKPEQKDLYAYVAPIAGVIEKAERIPRKTKVINVLKAWIEAVQALNWLVMPNGGVPFILSQADAAQFHINRALKVFKEYEEEKQGRYKPVVHLMKKMITELAEYAKAFHKQGIIWKFGGENLLEFEPQEGGSTAKASDEDRMETIAAAFEAYAAKVAGGDGDGPPPAIADWKALMDTEGKAFIDACAGIAEIDGKQFETWVTNAFAHTGKIVEATTEVKKPSDEDFGAFLAPIVEVIQATGNPDRRAKDFNYIKAFNEVIQVLAWVTMPGASDYIQSQVDSAQMYLNKVLIAAKKDTENQAAMRLYVSSIKALGLKVKEYTNEHFKQGLVWKGKESFPPAEYKHF